MILYFNQLKFPRYNFLRPEEEFKLFKAIEHRFNKMAIPCVQHYSRYCGGYRDKTLPLK